jgi:hypothetical protein
VLIFEMLTGKVPFGGDGYGEIIVKHVTMPPPSVRSVVPELPEYLDLICTGSSQRTATSASRTMAELEEALREPIRYINNAPEIGIPDDLSGIARAATPMARSEMDARSKIGFGSGLGSGDKPPGGTAVDLPRGARRADRAPDPEEAHRSGVPVRGHRRLRRRRRGAVRAAPRIPTAGAGGAGVAAPERGAHQLQLRPGRRHRRAQRHERWG